MDGSAVQEIKKTVLENQVVEIDGQKFGKGGFSVIRKIDRPTPIKGKSLTGLIDYLRCNRDNLDTTKLFIQINGHNSVSLFSTIEDSDKGRSEFFEAELDSALPVFRFEQYISIEEFIIKTRALFQNTADLDLAIATISRVTNLNATELADDGLSQGIQVKRGVSGALTDSTETKGVYTLAPYRTFRELKQPESQFILRLKAANSESMPMVALFDAEGEIWRHNAVLDIKSWLIEQLGDIDIPVIA